MSLSTFRGLDYLAGHSPYLMALNPPNAEVYLYACRLQFWLQSLFPNTKKPQSSRTEGLKWLLRLDSNQRPSG